MTRRGSKDVPGLPRSRWVLAHGDSDQVVAWSKPKQRPSWMDAEEYASLPEEITVRELRYRVAVPGYRVREITLVTTLLDAATTRLHISTGPRGRRIRICTRT